MIINGNVRVSCKTAQKENLCRAEREANQMVKKVEQWNFLNNKFTIKTMHRSLMPLRDLILQKKAQPCLGNCIIKLHGFPFGQLGNINTI